MKILHINAGEVWSGIEQRILFIARYLKNKNIYCAIAISPASPLWRKAKKYGIPLFPLPIKKKKDFASIRELRRIIKKEKINIVHAHRSTDHWIGVLSARFTNLNFNLIRTRHNFTPIPKNFFNHLLYLRWTDHIIGVAEKIRENLEEIKIPPEKVTIIHSAVDLERFSRKRKLKKIKGKLLIGMIGRIRKHKDYPTFLNFCKLFLEDFPEANFFIAGDGPLEKEMKRKAESLGIKDNVHFLGEREDIPEIISSLDIFVLTSKIEGSPAVIKEAMLSEIPVIATKVGGVPEIIEDGKEGLLVEPENPLEIKKAAIYLLTHQKDKENMIKRAKEKVISKFNPEILGRKTLEVYRKVINS